MGLTAEQRSRIREARSEDKKEKVRGAKSGRLEARARSREDRIKGAERAGRVAKHGTCSEYSNYGCKCDLCKAANAADVEARKVPCKNYPNCENRVHKNRNKSGYCRKCSNERGTNAVHGTERCYTNGCRKPECREAASAARVDRARRAKGWKDKRTKAGGVARLSK